MNENTARSNPPRRGRWWKILLWIVGVFVVLLVIAYFVVTSSGFVKSVVLPKIGNSMNADLTATQVNFSPFSQIVLHDVKLTPHGEETLLTANLVRARYHLFSIIGGNIDVDEVTVEAPVITLVEDADGTSNLDPLTKETKPEEKKPAGKSSEKPAQIDIKSVAIKNATIKHVKHLKDGGDEVIQLSNANLSLANLKNGSTGNLEFSGALAMDNTARDSAASLQSKFDGTFTLTLTKDLKPAGANGNAKFIVTKAAGAYSNFNALTATLAANATPTEIKHLALQFSQSGEQLGELSVSGPLDFSKMEGKLNVVLLGIDRRVLNLAGAANGMDFGTTTVNSTNVIELAKEGKIVTASGQLDAAQVRITRENQTTPTLDLRCDYAVTVDNVAKTAQLRTLNLNGTQNGQPLLKSELTSPMTISFGGANASAGDATLNLALMNLNLADWRAFAPDLSPEGMVNANAKLNSQQAGKVLDFDFKAQVTGLSAKLGETEIKQADATLHARGTSTDFKQFNIAEYFAEIARGGDAALTISGSGTLDTAASKTDLQMALRAALPKLLAMFPQPGTEFSSGSIELNGRVVSENQTDTVTGKLTASDLNGHYGDYQFTQFASAADLDIAKHDDTLDIRKLSGTLTESGKPGGKFDVTGKINTASSSGQLALSLADFNENGLRPFLQPSLGEKKLVSISLNATANADFQSSSNANAKAQLQVANLVVNDPSGAIPATPLEAKAQLDAGIAKQVAQIRECRLALTPTERAATNEVNISGTMDFSKTNATSGNLKLNANTLDVTRFYELFAAGKPNEQTTTASPQPQPHPTQENVPATVEREPDAVKLPVGRITFDANIGKFFVSEVEITNLQATAVLEGSHFVLKPCQLALNGGPVSAAVDVDLGVPGYRYDVNFSAKAVPIPPLVNTFQPERKGQVGGEFTADAQVKGAGITGASLQKSLVGKFDLGSTNLNLKVVNLKNGVVDKMLRTIINVIAAVPEILNNPTAAGSSLAGALFGGNANHKGLVNELADSPINVVTANGDMGSGKVNLQRAFVESPAFQAEATGEIILAKVLTNSTMNIPLHVSLERGIAARLNLAGDTPTNVAYAKLPDYVTVKGTLGEPKSKVDSLALIGTAAKSIGGVIPGVGEKAGGLIQGLGNILTGQHPQNTNAPATNSSNANQPAATNSQPNAADLIRGIGGLFHKQKSNPPTNPK